MALQPPGVGLGPLYNTPPNLSIPCSVPPFVYSHLSQVRGHVIQPSHFWSSSSTCWLQLSVKHIFFFGIAVSCILSIWPSHRILWHFINLTLLSLLIIASNSSFRQFLHNSFSFTGPYIFRSIFLSNTADALSSSTVSVHDSEPQVTAGRTDVRYICSWLFLDMRLLLTSCLFA